MDKTLGHLLLLLRSRLSHDDAVTNDCYD